MSLPKLVPPGEFVTVSDTIPLFKTFYKSTNPKPFQRYKDYVEHTFTFSLDIYTVPACPVPLFAVNGSDLSFQVFNVLNVFEASEFEAYLQKYNYFRFNRLKIAFDRDNFPSLVKDAFAPAVVVDVSNHHVNEIALGKYFGNLGSFCYNDLSKNCYERYINTRIFPWTKIENKTPALGTCAPRIILLGKSIKPPQVVTLIGKVGFSLTTAFVIADTS